MQTCLGHSLCDFLWLDGWDSGHRRVWGPGKVEGGTGTPEGMGRALCCCPELAQAHLPTGARAWGRPGPWLEAGGGAARAVFFSV